MGIATTNTLCTPKSVAVVASNEPVIFAHELGHVVGANHPCLYDTTLCNVETGIMSPSPALTGNYMGETQFAWLHQKDMCQGIRRARAGPSLIRECWVKLKQDLPERKIGIPLPGGCGGIENPTCRSCQGIYDARLQESGRCTYDPKSRRCVPVIWAHQYEGFGVEKNCPDCRLDKPAEETCHCGETVSCAFGETCEHPFVMAKTCSSPISGCMDKDAHNYNPKAVVDNGSCETCSDGIRNGDEIQTDCGGKCNQERCEWFIGASGESCKDTCWRVSKQISEQREYDEGYWNYDAPLAFYVDYEKMGKMTEEQCHNIMLAGTREVLGQLHPKEEILDGCFLYLSRENNENWVNNLWYKSSDSSLISAHSKRRGFRRACPCTTERPKRRNISWDRHKDHKCKATGVQRSHHYPWITRLPDCHATCEDAHDCLAWQFSDVKFTGEHYGCVTYHRKGVEVEPVPVYQTGVFSCTILPDRMRAREQMIMERRRRRRRRQRKKENIHQLNSFRSSFTTKNDGGDDARGSTGRETNRRVPHAGSSLGDVYSNYVSSSDTRTNDTQAYPRDDGTNHERRWGRRRRQRHSKAHACEHERPSFFSVFAYVLLMFI